MSKELSIDLKIELANVYAHDQNLGKQDIIDIVDELSTYQSTASDLIASYSSIPNLNGTTQETQTKLLAIVSDSLEFSAEEKQAFAQAVQQPSVASGSKVKI